MPDACYVELENRGILAVEGQDKFKFLQGLVSNDVQRVEKNRVIYSALLTPQGKYLYDFHLLEDKGRYLLECERDRLPDLRTTLNRYKLRSDITLRDVSNEHRVLAVFGNDAAAVLDLSNQEGFAGIYNDGIAFIDPRLKDLGARLVISSEIDYRKANFSRGRLDDYEHLRIRLCIPDGSRDMEVEKTVLLEAGLDELNGIDWNKGCYIGQELTARTKYRGLVKRRLLPVEAFGRMPESGTQITLDGRDAGGIRSGIGNMAIAMIRLNMLEKAISGSEHLAADGIQLLPRKPDWVTF